MLMRLCVGLVVVTASLSSAVATSPESVARGKKLFEREWTSHSPALGSDGLGPLFNATSCAKCHRQGGIGGGGEAQFNAKTVGIEEMAVSGGGALINDDVLARAVKRFHPGFNNRSGLVNTLPLHHFGGTSEFDASRTYLMDQVSAKFSEHGGPVNAAEVRRSNATPILYSDQSDGYTTNIRARIFQRNTTALFGAGLIDQVTAKQLRSIEREQKRHPEISGRLATLSNGRLGRFGWRANSPTLLDFCDQACAAEVGLRTGRKDQPEDPTVPNYRSPGNDISDEEITAMAAFVASLPAPVRSIPQDPKAQAKIAKGETLFASVGCAVCHRPNTGPAQGIYSDLLLHEMGHKSYDLNPADPYLTNMAPRKRTDYILPDGRSVFEVPQTYYGVETPISTTSRTTQRFVFKYPTTPVAGVVQLELGRSHGDFVPWRASERDKYPFFTNLFRLGSAGRDSILAGKRQRDTVHRRMANAAALGRCRLGSLHARWTRGDTARSHHDAWR